MHNDSLLIFWLPEQEIEESYTSIPWRFYGTKYVLNYSNNLCLYIISTMGSAFLKWKIYKNNCS